MTAKSARSSSIRTFVALAACLVAGITVSFANTSRAEITPWATNEGGRMRIVALPPEPDGTVRGALQIEPKPGWITYWKEPGDAGIPPQVVFSKASGVTLSHVSYPVPKRIDNGKLRDIGYDRPVTLPFELKVDGPHKSLNLGASAFVGLCRNICIPFQAEFSLALGSTKGTPAEEAMILNIAASRLPEGPSDDFAVTHYAMTHGRNILSLKLKLPEQTSEPPQVIVTGPEGHVLFDGINGRQDGDGYALDMPVGKLPKNYDINGKRWGILVIAGNRAMETSLAFE
ncbi:protein-disulfide reductase DsbD domain-containing protein [Neorhizobium petrolearium]|uniref:Protein-disulfide reductase DsbD family protein n=1 Tax=Neorhizobium petrolearium TaxID=515361 RepID=A0ABY8M3F1_9HYPH|nr:protein-disulfide reductase DsbD domain-containing protein [Neorhizobium petrolearium]MCC2608815.1 cytochrome C biogenesis protein [Neorhizobium petrolearium]WGI69067.1 protein-disulfide reductase DsbD family protein [Neorhizobium petrolearium]